MFTVNIYLLLFFGSVAIHRGFVNSHEGFVNSHEGFVNSHEGFVNSHEDAVNSHEDAVNSHRGFVNSHKDAVNSHKGAVNSHKDAVNSHKDAVINVKKLSEGASVIVLRHKIFWLPAFAKSEQLYLAVAFTLPAAGVWRLSVRMRVLMYAHAGKIFEIAEKSAAFLSAVLLFAYIFTVYCVLIILKFVTKLRIFLLSDKFSKIFAVFFRCRAFFQLIFGIYFVF
jgi:hypothetical protein